MGMPLRNDLICIFIWHVLCFGLVGKSRETSSRGWTKQSPICELILLLLLLTQLNCKTSILNSLSGYCWGQRILSEHWCTFLNSVKSIRLSTQKASGARCWQSCSMSEHSVLLYCSCYKMTFAWLGFIWAFLSSEYADLAFLCCLYIHKHLLCPW